MNILITGSNGFIARNLCKQLKEKFNYNITELNRNNCDLLDQNSVKLFFAQCNIEYDCVLHTAIEGGRRGKLDTREIVFNNLLMIYNLLNNQRYFKYMISFGSGAELDRRYHINDKSINRYPIDPYGLSKSVIDKLCADEPKLCNFRIYNCFGYDEQPDRMIRGNIQRYLNKSPIVLYQNKKMDFFLIDDLVSLINYCVKNNFFPKNINCCYSEKYTLLDIATIINTLDSYRVPIQIMDHTDGYDYIGKSHELPINYVGLVNGIKNIYNYYKNEKKYYEFSIT
jgi:nucleoside-diphosphate-sugar epimerase